MATTKPTIILVPRDWETLAHYEPLTTLLTTAGFHIIPITHATPGTTPKSTFAPDDHTVRHTIRRAIKGEIEKEHDIILLTHSDGAIPDREAWPSLLTTDLAATYRKGGVISVVYMTGFSLDEGKSLVHVCEALSMASSSAAARKRNWQAEKERLKHRINNPPPMPARVVVPEVPNDTTSSDTARQRKIQAQMEHMVNDPTPPPAPVLFRRAPKKPTSTGTVRHEVALSRGAKITCVVALIVIVFAIVLAPFLLSMYVADVNRRPSSG